MSNVTVQVGPSEKFGNGKILLHAVLGGTLKSEDIPLIKDWADSVRTSIKSLSEERIASICVIIDIRGMETYSDPSVITIITDLMKSDGDFIYKTATFGGTPLHEMIESVIKTMSGRANLRNFRTEAEALKWLKE